MSTTPFLGLDLPTPTVTLGPEWASQINTAFETVDSHNHTSGKGVQVPTAGLNIDDNLSFNKFKISSLNSAQFRDDLTSPLTGASNAGSVSVISGDLYYTNGSGVSVQVTSGGSLVSSPAAVNSFQFDNVNADLTINPSDDFVFLAVDTTTAKSINLPAASAVVSGRLYIVKDASGQSKTNNITVNASGSDVIDGSASIAVDSNFGTTYVIGNGVDQWYIL